MEGNKELIYSYTGVESHCRYDSWKDVPLSLSRRRASRLRAPCFATVQAECSHQCSARKWGQVVGQELMESCKGRSFMRTKELTNVSSIGLLESWTVDPTQSLLQQPDLCCFGPQLNKSNRQVHAV